MWITLDKDILTEEYGFLPKGKNRNVNDELAEELIANGQAHPKDEKKMTGSKKNKMITPKNNK